MEEEDSDNALGYLLEAGLPGKTEEEVAALMRLASFKGTFDSFLDQFKTNMASTLENLGYDNPEAYLISTAELPFAELPPLVLGKLLQEKGLNDENPNQLSENAADYLELSHLMRKAHGDLSLTYSAIGTLIERMTFERLPSDFIYGENNQTVGERLQEISSLDRANGNLMMSFISFLKSQSPEELDDDVEVFNERGEVEAAKWIEAQ